MEEKHFGPVWFIPGENRGKYPYCHSVYVEGPGILFDPASDRERLARLRKDPGVNMVWLSHYHEDHIMHLDLFEDLPIWIAEQDAPPISDMEKFLDAYGLQNKEHRQFWRDVLAAQFHYKPRKPAGFLKHGERFSFGSVTVEVIHTPGHTPGHMSFLFPQERVIFMGDYDLTRFGPWYGDAESSIEDTIASINRLRGIPASIFLTCHETGLFEEQPGPLWDAYLRVVDDRENKLLAFLHEPRTLEEIVGAWIIYGRPRDPAAFFELGERGHMIKHIERLARQGRVAAENGRFRTKGGVT
jgi:hydroxyacylglutathione hydrolase